MTDEERELINSRDMEIINANTDSLNAEALDVLRYQADVGFEAIDLESLDLRTIVRLPDSDILA
jgi:hypothetical protein